MGSSKKYILILLIILLSINIVSANDLDNSTVDDISSSDDLNNLEIESQEIASDDSQLDSDVVEDNSVANSYDLTNSTFNSYFNESTGRLLDSVEEGSTLNFQGEFSGLKVNNIIIDKKVNITGNGAVLKNISLTLSANDINMSGFDIEISNTTELYYALLIEGGSNIQVKNNFINITGVNDGEVYGIEIWDCDSVSLLENTLLYWGNGTSDVFNYGIEVLNSPNVYMSRNNFKLNMPSILLDTDWSTYNFIIYSSGLYVEYSDNFVLDENNISILFNGKISKSPDTLTGVVVRTSDNIVISGNNISLKGNTYSYAVNIIQYNDESTIFCNNFTLANNNITSEATNAYGAQIVSNGVIKGNNFTAIGKKYSYGIYTEGYYGAIAVNYYNNAIYSFANFVYGISDAGSNQEIINNTILVDGNCTMAIFSAPFNQNKAVVIKNNTLFSIGDGLATFEYGRLSGIFISRDLADIQNNTIITTGDYAVDLHGSGGISVYDNYLVAKSLIGDSAVYTGGNDNVSNNTPITCNIAVEAEDSFVGDNLTIVAYLPANATGKVTFNINGFNYTVDVINSTAKMVINTLDSGFYNITAIYHGDRKYFTCENKTNVTISKVDISNFTLTAGDVLFGKNVTVIANLPKDATGNVTFALNNKTYIASAENGQATIVISGLEQGSYNITATYFGDRKYNPITAKGSVNVLNNSVILSGENIELYYKNGTRYYVELSDIYGKKLAAQNITITINGVSYKRTTNENGTASIAINLNSGNYTVNVLFNDSKDYKSAEITNNVTVLSTVCGNDVTKIFRNGTQYYATFVDANGKALANATVTFNINGVFYNRTTDENGTASLNISLNPGKYVITAYNPNTTEMASNNVTVLASIISDDLVKYFRNGSQFLATILGADGNLVVAGENVTFNINGVIYTRQTNENSTAKLNINLNPGNYTITTSYNGLNVANNIEVLPTIETEDISMTTTNRSAFEAQILDANGNPVVAGENVTFNINGVIYEKQTNASGVAKLNINLNPGEYIITTSYNGLNAANTVTVNQ